MCNDAGLRRRASMGYIFAIIITLFWIVPGFAIETSNYNPEFSIEQQQAMLKAYTHLAAQGLGGLLTDRKEEEQMDMCRSFVQPIRFFDDNSGYFYIYNLKGLNIAHATQADKVGKDLWDYKDSKGNLLIQALCKAAGNGGGFVEFWWENPLSGKEERKLGYAEPIPNSDFFIGSGIYLGD